jgi:hypothetical protein
MSSYIKHWIKLSLLLATVLSFCSDTACLGAVKEMTQALPDDYLGTQFAWTMVLDLPDTSYYLNYPGSKLWPITKVRIHLNSYRQDTNRIPSKSTYYEEFWYHKQSIVGLRRFNQFALFPLSLGAIIVCPAENTSSESQRIPAITDSIVRLLVDIQFHNAVTGLVLVPESEYDDIAEALAQYNFFAPDGTSQMRAVSIRLRAYPQGKENIFYLQNQPK